MTTTTVRPLPQLGLCPVCEGEIRIRKTGLLYLHERPVGPDGEIVFDDDGYWMSRCPGSARQPAALLEPTFARWLYTHRNGDAYTNRVAHLADAEFNGCTYSPNRTPVDVTWATADELHQRKHDLQRQWTGSEIRQPYNGQRCDWVCRDIQHAAKTHAELLIKESL